MDICMAQKSHFKAVKTGTYIKRYTFPQLPWAELEKPKTLKTKRGELLLDGFWAYLRKPSESAFRPIKSNRSRPRPSHGEMCHNFEHLLISA